MAHILEKLGQIKGVRRINVPCLLRNWNSRVFSLLINCFRTTRFEKITKKNRTLEREVKVYTELLRDLRAFVKDRVGNNVTLNLPNLYHGFTAKNDPGPDGDRYNWSQTFTIIH